MKLYIKLLAAIIICISCEKENAEENNSNNISFSLNGEKVVFNDGYFDGGNTYVDDTRCSYPKCMYNGSYVQFGNSDQSKHIYISFSDSLTGTYSFSSDNNHQLKAIAITYNDSDYGAYPYYEGTGDFIVEVIEFGSIGERIKGTFSGTASLVVEGVITDQVLITNGEFDIKRKEY